MIIVNLIYRQLQHIRLRGVNVKGSTSVGRNLEIIGPHNIIIGNKFHAGRDCKLQAFSNYNGKELNANTKLIIGDNVSMMSHCHVSCVGTLKIGDGTLMGDNVFITDNNHGSSTLSELQIEPIKRELGYKGDISIGKNVWIGRNVCVIGNVSIGDGAIIGANSVVTKDIPPNAVAAGVPARVIRTIE